MISNCKSKMAFCIFFQQKMQIKPLEAKLYGKFNIGDAYIVLNVSTQQAYRLFQWWAGLYKYFYMAITNAT